MRRPIAENTFSEFEEWLFTDKLICTRHFLPNSYLPNFYLPNFCHFPGSQPNHKNLAYWAVLFLVKTICLRAYFLIVILENLKKIYI
jgi:hypothetical protein